MPQTLVFATNNAHKAQEVQQILGADFDIKTLREIGCFEDIPETENTLEGNALLKARFVKEKFGLDCFSDDSGLEVAALGGAPGVYSARYAGENRRSEDNIQLLLKNLAGVPDRRAQFRAVVALIVGGREMLLEGVCTGHITQQKVGMGGFGYDPVFIPDGYEQTFAEMGEQLKNRISHRAKAMEKLLAALRSL